MRMPPPATSGPARSRAKPSRPSEYKAETSSDGKAGADGVHTFTYQAEGSGEATITLKYARSWEASDADKTVVVKTEVKDGAFAEASVQ